MVISSQPIGIFDSGVGGLTVMQQLIRALPNERFIYFGDTARVPYGNKSPQTIVRYTVENAIYLLEHNVKLLVIACNTATAFALPKLRQLFRVPIVGVIDAGAARAVEISHRQRIAILGTKGTIQSGAYQAAIHSRAPDAFLLPIACPLLVPLVEEQWLTHSASQLIIREYLRPIRDEGIDTILLGCTHYPLLDALFREELGPDIAIVDSASTCVLETSQILKERALASPIRQGNHQYFVSDDPEKFRSLAERLFHTSPMTVELAVSSDLMG